MPAKILWTARTDNKKTGNVPTAWIGSNRDEAWASCEGCSLRDSKDCYAWFGSVRMGQASIFRGYALNPRKYTFSEAMKARHPHAKMVRIGAIGDPARASHRELRRVEAKVRKLGMAFIGYTHHHREPKNAKLASLLMASCETMEQADDAVSRGWRATTIVPWDFSSKRFLTPAGNVGVVCPAQTNPSQVTCNSCRLCDAGRNTTFKVIAFKAHGPKERPLIRKARKLPIV